MTAALGLALASVMGLSPVRAAGPVRLVALGDSLTAGYGLPRPDGFAPKLEKALRARGRDVTVANAGVSGDTASGGADRVELGANDMLRGVAPNVTKSALTRLLDRLKARKIPAMLAGMRAAPNLGPDYRAAFDRIYPDLARERGLVLYPFFLEGVAGDRTLNLPDGLHPTAAGVDAIVAGILPSVERFLDQIAAARS